MGVCRFLEEARSPLSAPLFSLALNCGCGQAGGRNSFRGGSGVHLSRWLQQHICSVGISEQGGLSASTAGWRWDSKIAPFLPAPPQFWSQVLNGDVADDGKWPPSEMSSTQCREGAEEPPWSWWPFAQPLAPLRSRSPCTRKRSAHV